MNNQIRKIAFLIFLYSNLLFFTPRSVIAQEIIKIDLLQKSLVVAGILTAFTYL